VKRTISAWLYLLPLICGTLVADNVSWTDADSHDHLWTSPGNWTVLPADGDAAFICTPQAAAANGPMLNPDATVPGTGELSHTIVGHLTDGTANMTMTGGTLNTHYLLIGWHNPAVGCFKMSGGTINLDTMSIGTHSGTGSFTMTGGQINATNNLLIPWVQNPDEPGCGHLDLHGGTLRTKNLTINNTGSIDITEGILIITGDQLTTVENYRQQGRISAFGGQGKVVTSLIDANTYVIAAPQDSVIFTIQAYPPEMAFALVPETGIYFCPKGETAVLQSLVGKADQPYIDCPNVYHFHHWATELSDPNNLIVDPFSTNTCVLADANLNITAVYCTTNQCGCCGYYPPGDLCADCLLNLADLACLAGEWFTEPNFTQIDLQPANPSFEEPSLADGTTFGTGDEPNCVIGWQTTPAFLSPYYPYTINPPETSPIGDAGHLANCIVLTGGSIRQTLSDLTIHPGTAYTLSADVAVLSNYNPDDAGYRLQLCAAETGLPLAEVNQNQNPAPTTNQWFTISCGFDSTDSLYLGDTIQIRCHGSYVLLDNVRLSVRTAASPNDLNADGQVNIYDIAVLSKNWLQETE